MTHRPWPQRHPLITYFALAYGINCSGIANLTHMLPPVHGSHFDMRLGGPVMAFVAGMLSVRGVPRTLARFSVRESATP